MGIRLSEQLSRLVNNPFKGFEGFFSKDRPDYKSVRKIKLPPDHELQGKIKSMRLIEFEPNENFERNIILIEDKLGNKFAVLSHRDIFKSTNRQDVPGYEEGKGETSARIVYGEASNVSKIEFIKKIDFEKPYEEAEKIAFESAKKLTTWCELSEIKSNNPLNNIQLSGAHVVVIEDFKKPKTVNSEQMRSIISFLFGPNGPLNNMIILPEERQETLMKQIRAVGGRTLLHGPDSDPRWEITIPQFFKLSDELFKKARVQLEKIIPEEDVKYLVSVFMATVPNIIHIHKTLVDGKKFGGETFVEPFLLNEYIIKQLNHRLQSFVDSAQG